VLDEEVANGMGICEEAIRQIATIPDAGRHTAGELLAETGLDMSRSPSLLLYESIRGLDKVEFVCYYCHAS